MTNRTTTAVRFILLAGVWGSSFTLIRVALDGLSPAQVVLGRLLTGTVVMLVLLAARRVGLPRGGAIWAQISVAALLTNVAPFLLLSWGEQSTGAGVAGVVVGSTPLLTLALAAVALPAEPITGRRVAGLAAGFAGVALVAGPWRASAGSSAGLLACFAGAACYAAGFVYVRRVLSPRGLPPLVLAAAQLVAATGLQVLAMPWLPAPIPHLTGSVVASVAVLGVIGTAYANVLYFRLVSDIGATGAAAVNYLAPVVAVLVGAAALGEPVTWNEVAGGALVLAAMAYAEGRIGRPRGAEIPIPQEFIEDRA
jgi:drug/metabolite transporter (DMT)-like permease